MRQFFFRLFDEMLNCLFPVFCLGCKTEGNFLCGECLKSFHRLETQVCPWCYKPSDFGATCARCAHAERFLDGVMVCSRFEENSLLQRAVHALKYDFIEALAPCLGFFLFETFLPRIKKNFSGKISLCPLPLHDKRLNWRGFNQAELLCRELLSLLHKAGYRDSSMDELLERVHFSRPQMELAREERMTNVSNAFRLKDAPGHCVETTVFLVDDIATTLSTLNNAAAPLKKAGFERVYGLVLARVF